MDIPATNAPIATQNVPTWRSNSTLLTSSLRELNMKAVKIRTKQMRINITDIVTRIEQKFYPFP